MAGASHSPLREAGLGAPRASGYQAEPEGRARAARRAPPPGNRPPPPLLSQSLSSALGFSQSFPNTKTNTWKQPPARGEELVSARQMFQQLTN